MFAAHSARCAQLGEPQSVRFAAEPAESSWRAGKLAAPSSPTQPARPAVLRTVAAAAAAGPAESAWLGRAKLYCWDNICATRYNCTHSATVAVQHLKGPSSALQSLASIAFVVVVVAVVVVVVVDVLVVVVAPSTCFILHHRAIAASFFNQIPQNQASKPNENHIAANTERQQHAKQAESPAKLY